MYAFENYSFIYKDVNGKKTTEEQKLTIRGNNEKKISGEFLHKRNGKIMEKKTIKNSKDVKHIVDSFKSKNKLQEKFPRTEKKQLEK